MLFGWAEGRKWIFPQRQFNGEESWRVSVQRIRSLNLGYAVFFIRWGFDSACIGKTCPAFLTLFYQSIALFFLSTDVSGIRTYAKRDECQRPIGSTGRQNFFAIPSEMFCGVGSYAR